MKYDKNKYKIWDWKSPVILHYIINPGVVVSDLFLGQTMPKITLIEREGDKPLYQRSFTPCPHCGELHSAVKYSAQNKTAAKNWYGFYCDKCTKIIPIQRNLTSLLLLLVTFPIWGWFAKTLKQNWLDKQPERYKNLDLDLHEEKNTTKNWLKFGLIWGLFMYVTMTLLMPLINQEEITQRSLLIGIPIWLIAGLGFGLVMKIWMNKKGKETKAPVELTNE